MAEFTKRLRILVLKIRGVDGCLYIPDVVDAIKIEEACVKLDRLAAEDESWRRVAEGLERVRQQLQAEIKGLREEKEAVIRRAEAAESDWQVAETENKELKAKVDEFKNIIGQLSKKGK